MASPAEDQLLRKYFQQGLSYIEIQMLMYLNHGIELSYRTLKRRLRNLDLKKVGNWSLDEIIPVIQMEIKEGSKNLGCRSLSRRLFLKHGIFVGRNTAMCALRILDPEGVSLRSQHCLSRRQYYNQGPNFLVHIDGYDKLKPFGFCIHGAICGFSRRILWLRVARTNNNPKVVASYFLDYVEEIAGVPRCIRIDAGTENGHIEDMQKAFRWNDDDAMAGDKSVIIGSSTSNQRIERWWRSLRQLGVGYWIDFFKDLEMQGYFTCGNPMHIECLRFCFMAILQRDLDHIRKDWNTHNIRHQSKNVVECPSGKPDIMFFNPELYDAVDYKFPVEIDDIEAMKNFCELPNKFGCREDTLAHLMDLMRQGGKSIPCETEEAVELFLWILQQLRA